jgi:hypothetical protein
LFESILGGSGRGGAAESLVGCGSLNVIALDESFVNGHRLKFRFTRLATLASARNPPRLFVDRATDKSAVRVIVVALYPDKRQQTIKGDRLPHMPLILILVILLLLFGGGGYYMGPGVGYYGGGGLSLVLLIVILFLLFGRGRTRL